MVKTFKQESDHSYEFDSVDIPLQWHPPGDRLDSENFNIWVAKGIAAAADPQRWTVGLLVRLNELQIRRAIEGGSRLVQIDSPLPPGWTSIILDAVAERLEHQGFELPSLIVTCEAGGGVS